jgi:uncharacterized protein YjbI with pentapeptide repeats
MNYYMLGLIVALVVVAGGIFFTRGGSDDTGHSTDQSYESERQVGAGASTPEVRDDKKLDLSDQSLTSVSRSTFDNISIESLDLSGNELSGALQAEIRLMKNLRVLDLSDNNFTGVPAEVGQLSELEILDLSNNPITGLPYEIGNLKNLKILDLRGTQYSVQDLDAIRQNLSSEVEIRTD